MSTSTIHQGLYVNSHTLLNTDAWICDQHSTGAAIAKAKQCQWTVHCYARKDSLDRCLSCVAAFFLLPALSSLPMLALLVRTLRCCMGGLLMPMLLLDPGVSWDQVSSVPRRVLILTIIVLPMTMLLLSA